MEEQNQRVAIATGQGLRRADQAEPIAFANKHVRGLALDSVNCYAIVGRHEVWSAPRSAIRGHGAANGESSWRMLARLEEQLWSLYRFGDELLVGSEAPQLYRIALKADSQSGDGLVAVGKPELDTGFAENPDRSNWFTPWGGPPSVRSMTSDSDGALYANVHVGGIHRQAPGDDSWTQMIEIDFDVHQILCANGLLLAPGGKGFAQRALGEADGSAAWEKTTDGLDFSYMRAVAVSDTTLLASASNGPHGDRGAVYSRPLGSSEPFRKCCVGLPQWFDGNIDTFCLVADGPTVAVGSPGGYVFVSSDSGDVWTEAARDLPEINAVALV